MTDDDDDWNGEDSSEEDESDDDEPIACPECGATMHGYIDKCGTCGYWLTEADRRLRPGEKRPAWQRVTAAIIIAAFVICLLLAGLTIF